MCLSIDDGYGLMILSLNAKNTKIVVEDLNLK